METKDITANNVLIAEFMGLNLLKDTQHWRRSAEEQEENHKLFCINEGNSNWYSVSANMLEYDTSWDWLMPVVEKIESTKAKEGFYFDVDILSTGVIISSAAKHIVQITQEEIQSTSKIEAVYNAVVEFIKWYNQNTGQ